jgi:cobalamin biosynthesis protein CobD/CbiB
MAWLLGVELGGPAAYHGVVAEKPTIGRASREPNASDIGRAHAIMDWGVSLFLLVSLLILPLLEKISAGLAG